MTIVQYATIPIKPDEQKAAIEALSALGEASREEEGVVEYRVTTDVDDESTVRIIEEYENEDAVNAHSQSEHYGVFRKKVGDFAAGPIQLYKYTVSEKSQLR
jgi:quinol monooxygenase YgiN